MLKIGWNDGHTLSGVGTGATGIINETARNRSIGKLVKKKLSTEYKDVVIVDCTIDYSSNDMYDAVSKANANNCDVFISNHVNAGGGVGFEGFYSRYQNTDIDKGSIIYKELVGTNSCLMNRRYCSDYSYKGYDLYVLKNTKMPAFLYEIGFVDNRTCCDSVDVTEVANAYVSGIAKAYGLVKKSNDPKWVKDSIGWWFDNGDGTYPKQQWLCLNNIWYYFGSDGYAYKNKWLYYNNKWYRFNDDCSMIKSEISKIDNNYYAFDSDGIMKETSISINSSGQLQL